ncbi:MAG TPA: AraC family transcriptional regulator [Clostridiales bacterium]|nr:AraC family transcriptional regulator [Clostridiales bacterium]
MYSSIFEPIELNKQYPAKVFAMSIDKSDLHWHYEYEMILVLKGSLLVREGSESTRLEAGDVILINSHVAHELFRAEEDNICLFLQLHHSLLSDPSHEHCTYHYYLNSKGTEFSAEDYAGEVTRLLTQIGISSYDTSHPQTLKIKGYLYLLASVILERVPYDIYQNAENKREADEMEILSNIIDYIQREFKSETVLEDMYRNIGMSEKSVYRLLKSSIGMTAKDLILSFKINFAQMLLKSTQISINVISEECGFDSENTFYRVFKKYTGVTPNEYRKYGAAVAVNKNIQGYLGFNMREAQELLVKLSENT